MAGIEVAFATVLSPRWSEGATVATSSTAGTLNTDLIGPQTAGQSTESTTARGKYITVCAMTTDCWIVFADTSAKADDLAVATAGTNQTTFSWPLTAGIPQSFYVGKDYNWIGHRTASAAGTLTVYISSTKT